MEKKYNLTEYEYSLIRQANEDFYKRYPNYGKSQKKILTIKKKLSYKEYIKSEQWKRLTRKVLKRAKGICEVCKINRAWQVHHKTYKRLFYEKMSDLIAVCGICHQDKHNLLTEEKLELATEKLLIKTGIIR